MENEFSKSVNRLGINGLKRPIFLCCDQAKPQCCDGEESLNSWNYLKTRLKVLKRADQGGIYRTKGLPARLYERAAHRRRLSGRSLVPLMHSRNFGTDNLKAFNQRKAC